MVGSGSPGFASLTRARRVSAIDVAIRQRILEVPYAIVAHLGAAEVERLEAGECGQRPHAAHLGAEEVERSESGECGQRPHVAHLGVREVERLEAGECGQRPYVRTGCDRWQLTVTTTIRQHPPSIPPSRCSPPRPREQRGALGGECPCVDRETVLIIAGIGTERFGSRESDDGHDEFPARRPSFACRTARERRGERVESRVAIWDREPVESNPCRTTAENTTGRPIAEFPMSV